MSDSSSTADAVPTATYIDNAFANTYPTLSALAVRYGTVKAELLDLLADRPANVSPSSADTPGGSEPIASLLDRVIDDLETGLVLDGLFEQSDVARLHALADSLRRFPASAPSEPPSTWLMDSLRESSERAAELPQWAKDVNAAHDAQYGPASAAPREPEPSAYAKELVSAAMRAESTFADVRYGNGLTSTAQARVNRDAAENQLLAFIANLEARSLSHDASEGSERLAAAARSLLDLWDEMPGQPWLPMSERMEALRAALSRSASAPEPSEGLTIRDMQRINQARSNRWMAGSPGWTTLEIAGELAGEVGELANVCKKLRRSELGVPGNKLSDAELLDQARGEAADVFIVLMLTASKLNIDLQDAVCETFNKKSEQMGFPERLGAARSASAGDGSEATALDNIAAVTEPLALLLVVDETVSARDILPQIQRINRIVRDQRRSPSREVGE